MKVKNIIAQSADARRFSNWLEAQNGVGFEMGCYLERDSIPSHNSI